VSASSGTGYAWPAIAADLPEAAIKGDHLAVERIEGADAEIAMPFQLAI